MLMILAQLARSESFWAVAKVFAPRTPARKSRLRGTIIPVAVVKRIRATGINGQRRHSLAGPKPKHTFTRAKFSRKRQGPAPHTQRG